MDLRENIPNDFEEVLRTIVAGLLKGVWTAMPVQVTEDTKDGHTSVLQPTIKRQVIDPETGATTFEDHPVHPDVPIHYIGGGGVTTTHPVKKGDEGLAVYASRPLDTWHQSGDTQQPADNRMHNLADAVHIPGIRSDPRKIQQVSNESHQTRSDDKKHVSDLHPTNGITHKSVDPSTPPASAGFDPFTTATKFISHIVQAAQGVIGSATDAGTTHDHGVTHDLGAFMRAANQLHTVLAHPENGASLNALNALHSVLAHPTQGALLSAEHGAHTVTASPSGVMLSSTSSIGLSAPSLSLPAGGVGSSALASGAASDNVGTLGGDLSGTLPNPNVIGITHVANANTLPVCASDAAAAGVGVVVGGLYVNTSAVTGYNLLAVRLI